MLSESDIDRIKTDPVRVLIKVLTDLDGPSVRVCAAMNVYVWNYPNIQIREIVRAAAEDLQSERNPPPVGMAISVAADLSDRVLVLINDADQMRESIEHLNIAIDDRDAQIKRLQDENAVLQERNRALARSLAERRACL